MKGLFALATATVLGLGATGCMSTEADWRERYLEKERDASEATTKLTEERSAHAAAVAQLEEARRRLSAYERGEGAPSGGPSAAAAPAIDSGVTAEVDRLRSTGLDVHQTSDGNIAIVLPADINFGAGSKELTTAGKKAVDQVIKELNGSFSGYSIRVEGHTDGDPIKRSNFKDNWELGSERALSVLRHLSTGGISSERLTAATRGETMPVADNKSDQGKAKNRRVEVVVLVPRGSAMAK
jgi:flagellar motor protein MotB